ncbi:uncharacterized protein BT62DRAFT_963532 [Guyanagaster necrorhizus]|uniref:DNA helicase n=1 Tax=Guyanagaster necrorhizus TaxID=856835 RepID=A0A9P7W077_9AGAR|nr:uncharacterized protein BT62DRAFT_963532 [Guyanagaster necrorhizus MCA 3950]KAG7449980.1 hypothetical protein BT62DRAFT_963532 [Guyanagaster necrorhizus MCA 3950]
MAPTSLKRGRNQTMQNDAQEAVEARREALVEERQRQLESIYDRHDTLVREAFHMETFTLMLGYDPKEAKAEQTGVINDYKAQFDLLNTAGPSSGRRTRSERRQVVTAPTYVSRDSVEKGKGKANSTTIWDILSTARPSPVKGKGKEKASMSTVSAPAPTGRNVPPKDLHSMADVEMDFISPSINKSRKKAKFGPSEITEGPSVVGWRHTSISTRKHVGGTSSGELAPTTGRRLRSQDTTSAVAVAVAADAPPEIGPSAPEPVSVIGRWHNAMEPSSTPRKQFLGGSGSEVVPLSGKCLNALSNGVSVRKRPREESVAESLTGKSPATISTRGGRALPARAAAHRVTAPPPAPPPSPYSNIKRVKLIVRRPPPSYSNPNQLPPPPKHGSSISAFLSSYTTMDHKDVSTRVLQGSIRHDAEILERASKLKEEGRWFYRAEEEGDIAEDLETPQGPERTTKDVWDCCIEQIIALGQAEIKRPVGAQIASQIASKVETYWEGQHAKRDKKRAQEEKRLRVLAKQTIKEVTSAWGKIVLHIRRQEQVEREAEELKRGHEHLDAILDQSGLLLETQQSSLARRSRSTSSDGLRIWGSEGSDSDDSEGDGEAEDEDGGESGEEEPEQDQSDSGEEGDDDVDGETTALLGGNQDTPTSQSIEVSPTSLTSVLPSKDSVALDDAVNDESLMLTLEDLLILPESSPPATLTSSSYPLGSPSLPSLLSVQASEAPSMDDSVAPSDYAETVPSSLSVEASPRQYERHASAQPLTASEDARPAEVQSAAPAIDLPSCETQVEGTIDTLDEVSPQSALDEKMEVNGADPFANAISDETCPCETNTDAGVNGTEPHAAPRDEPEEEEQELPKLPIIPEYLKPFAVAPVEWDADAPIKPPLLLRGVLRPYQQTGLEWLTTLHRNNLNGILADEMGLGKTIQTISLLAHLACDRGIWGPHLIIVPTSVLLNWEMEFKKFLPGFRVLGYHGTTKRRKELRQGWNDKYHFNVCITSYTLASRDAHIFKRRAWYYMILDEAHMIKNFRSQRWNILLMFRSFRRLLLTGTPLQNNLTELWALLQFLMSGSNFANLKEFGDWFSNPLEKAIEMGNAHDDETMQRVSKLHTVLRPYLLRRLKRDVEKELPTKFEHLMLCPLSKRQRYLYDEFMSRAHTQDALQSGVYQKIANILMQLRKVCNHPDLFEVRPIVTSFAMTRSAVAGFEIKELLIRRHLLAEEEESVNLDFLGLRFIGQQNTSEFGAMEVQNLDATSRLPFIYELPGEPPPKDVRSIDGFRAYTAWKTRADKIAHWTQVAYVNRHRIQMYPIASREMIAYVGSINKPILPLPCIDQTAYLDTVITTHRMVKTYTERSDEMASIIDHFAFATPAVVALDIPRLAFPSLSINQIPRDFDAVLHKSSAKLQIAFPDPLLLQYDCGKLQQLNLLLREKKAGGHRVLIFTQMTRILDILEIFLNFHGYLYLRLDGATKIEDRQYITERFNADSRVFCFIASSRSGGVGINLTGADTVVFYDSDFNPQMDRQCEDRAHRIGQMRDVHIYRFVSQYTVEEAMLRKANQKRSLDDLVIQKGGFDWRTIFNDEKALTNALEEFDDQEDAHAAAVATREEVAIVGADEADFGEGEVTRDVDNRESSQVDLEPQPEEGQEEDEEDDEGGTVADYMLAFVKRDYDYFKEWRV